MNPKNTTDKTPAGVSIGRKALLALLFLVPALLMIGKSPMFPTSDFLEHWLSFAHMPALARHRLEYVLFVPLGAAVVVFFRLTLGIRLLGPFRSVLIAVAFQITGILPGLFLLLLIIGAMVAMRPLLKTLRVPYFARISIMLSAVSFIMIGLILAGEWLGAAWGERAAYFPIVVICLIAEGFARTQAREGWPSALWRGSMTALVAVTIALISQIPFVPKLLMKFPELLITQVGVIVLVATFFDWRLLDKFPARVKKRKRIRPGRPLPFPDEAALEPEKQVQTS